ncbi:inorganic diphosphatase [bacterium endosymbiont of Pedicinus badii]|uniref:inorganic diphosphatase n=1 Tax=bacterium endosymbiont of Pedicinus badii TaxID=1719126 RepID=UPI0009B98C26|nr:inorganic diphosphatase [bacterium endosymbiont of Pedicinus badii]OQM34182.1 inorganic pyrophosphatase [bacterium endosymbiont of Pedicinus badii]
MNFSNVPIGKKFPENIYVTIEISSHSNYSVKYEIDKKKNIIFVDRFLSTSMTYPYNYGYINGTKSNDGDPLDALVITHYPILVGSVILSKPIGVLKTEDESGMDSKIISVPNKKITQDYQNINDIYDLPKSVLEKILHFFQHYKDLEKNKWSKIHGWNGRKSAKKEILLAFQRNKKK